MAVLRITQQQKRTDRFSVYVDGKYRFSLSTDTLLVAGLKNGQQIEPAELEKLLLVAEEDKSFDRSLRFIALRPRSEWEVEQYLKRKQYDPAIIDATVERLRDARWLDDELFAVRWVANRRLLRSASRKRLIQELRQKHVASDAIHRALGAEAADDLQALREVIEKKRRQTKYQDQTKLMQYLARQGFGYDDIKRALAEGTD